MTTEDDFQRALDVDTTDWQTRLVFADWLAERGDPRAEGYRALGTLRWTPWRTIGFRWRWWDLGHFLSMRSIAREPYHGDLPGDWFGLVEGELVSHHKAFDTRALAEDAAALAFGFLPMRRRRSLLTASAYARRKRAKKKVGT
jgi:uncharacterized protein (TIGR02996 family)